MRNGAIHFEQVPMNVVEAILRRAASAEAPEELAEPALALERESRPEVQEPEKSAPPKGQR